MSEKIYLLVHKETGAKVTCNQKFLIAWFAKGFEVEAIKEGDIMTTTVEDFECSE